MVGSWTFVSEPIPMTAMLACPSQVQHKRFTTTKEALSLESGGEHSDSREGSSLWIRVLHVCARGIAREWRNDLGGERRRRRVVARCAMVTCLMTCAAAFGPVPRFGPDKCLTVSNFPYLTSFGQSLTESVDIRPNLFLQCYNQLAQKSFQSPLQERSYFLTLCDTVIR